MAEMKQIAALKQLPQEFGMSHVLQIEVYHPQDLKLHSEKAPTGRPLKRKCFSLLALHYSTPSGFISHNSTMLCLTALN